MSTGHVVIIGAARSGTKMLRDAVAEATGAGKVPYDINYVWRAGNEKRPDDMLAPTEVPERTRRFIRSFVDRYAEGHPPTVIEKTVGNTMRVPVVHAVLPEARYIHLRRHGVDVIESTRRQWLAPSDVRYLLGKVRHFPIRMIPTYGVKYLRSLAGRRSHGDGRLGSWGPRYPGIEKDLRERDLLIVCARQWRCAIEQATGDIHRLGLPVLDVSYEDLVASPASHLALIARFAGLSTSPANLQSASAAIRTEFQGTGRGRLTIEELAAIDAEVGDTLTKLGYDRPNQHRNGLP